MDSGSLRIYNLMKILQELGYKVVFWPENRAYHERYTRDLQHIGIEAIYGDVNFEEYLKSWGRYLDLIFLSRPHVAIQYIYPAKKLTRARVIYDTVDLHFLREKRQAPYTTEKIVTHWKNMEMFLAHQADDTLVVSPVEKEILEKEKVLSRVSVISNIHPPETAYAAFEHRIGLMFIGGFLHQPNEDGVIWFVQSILPLIREKKPDIQFTIVGSHPTEAVQALASDHITVTGYVPDPSLYFEKARVFVCPLRYGAGVKGKIGQSLSFGLPVVTTSIGAEGMGLSDGRDALIAGSEADFADKTLRVYDDKRLWESLSLNGTRLVREAYSPQAMKENLRKLLAV
jgi:glycosyltransferase involved in cell wall biosynthesis